MAERSEAKNESSKKFWYFDAKLRFAFIATLRSAIFITLINLIKLFSDSSNPFYGYTGGQNTIGFGIPTGAIISDTDGGALSIPANAASTVWNLYFASGTDSGNKGKTHPGTAAMTSLTATGQEQRQMAYWGVLGASRSWWASDLIAIQNEVATSTALDKTSFITV